MKVEFVSLANNPQRASLLWDYFTLRKQVFVDGLMWNLPEHRGAEFEQYDTVHAVYAILTEGGRVVGGARLLPTDVVQPNGYGARAYTYMIKDAFDGFLPGLPRGVCDCPPPEQPYVWELTRFVSVSGAGAGKLILKEVNKYLADLGVSECLFLSSPAFMVMAKRMGYAPRALGKVVSNESGEFLAFSCGVVHG